MAAEPQLPRVALRPGSLGLLLAVAGVLTVCCLCQLVPGATADWGTVYCETKADSFRVAEAQSAMDYFTNNTKPYDLCCNDDGPDECTTYQAANAGNEYYHLGACSPVTHCDNCHWVKNMWTEVLQQCTMNYDGVDRVGGYVAYDWSPGVWAHYRVWHTTG